MHPDIARQLAAERHADFRRDVKPAPGVQQPRRRWRLRLGGLARYAGAPTGARTGT
jgi:hypothetical protein